MVEIGGEVAAVVVHGFASEGRQEGVCVIVSRMVFGRASECKQGGRGFIHHLAFYMSLIC